MSKAVDPFDEYLLKRKVEILEEKFRKQGEVPEVEDEEAVALAHEDPEVAARLKEEMEEFFDAGKAGAAEVFERTPVPEIDEDVVEELKEALDEVFDDDAAVPKVDRQDTFVEFFKQVQEDFSDEQPGADLPEPDSSALPAGLEEPTLEDLPTEPESAASQEKPVVFKLDDQAAAGAATELDPEALPPMEPAQTPAPSEEPEDESRSLELEDTVQDIGAPVEAMALSAEKPHLDLSEILLPLRENATEEEMRRHLELLCRLIAKLVERAALPESEIIEVLIKSRVEF
ncbi:MAG: hypothetical protein ACE10D_03050 [Planctomycetota bacterium]